MSNFEGHAAFNGYVSLEETVKIVFLTFFTRVFTEKKSFVLIAAIAVLSEVDSFSEIAMF